ncbi:hypothetical protein [Nocardia sp. NPDC058705]|uniref:hypothetical protein n=1 Tax=Nocardia sp. NPDC058705 TaxID=3346609 RepID=UPI0036B1ACE2
MDIEALTGNDPVAAYRALRIVLVSRLGDANTPPGIIPALAKQVSDLTRLIAEYEPYDDGPSDIDEFTAVFNAPIE